jgi:ABC-type Na+ transport system ATPase subunit NatA
MNAYEALAVQAAGLGRSFGQNRAVDGVDLTIPIGMIFGLLGPDGAGKSTLIRMLATVLAPDTGDATIFGNSVRRSPGRVIPRIGYMSQNFSMYPDLSVSENLNFFATLRGISRAERKPRAAALMSAMGLVEFADMRARNLSGGMKQKLMLAATLIHQPDLLLLDEPTTGVDPVSRREFWRILARLHREGRTVLVSTPYMDEAERCSYLASFSSSSYFTIEAYLQSETELEPLMDRGEVQVAIVIPEGTQARLESGEIAPGIVVDGSDSRTAAVSSGYAAQIVAQLNADRMVEQGLALSSPGIDARVRVLFNPSLRTVNTMIPGLVAAILMLSVMAIMSQAVVRERESGTLEQMFVTPITRGEYLIGKVTPYVLLAVLQMSLVALVGISGSRSRSTAPLQQSQPGSDCSCSPSSGWGCWYRWQPTPGSRRSRRCCSSCFR